MGGAVAAEGLRGVAEGSLPGPARDGRAQDHAALGGLAPGADREAAGSRLLAVRPRRQRARVENLPALLLRAGVVEAAAHAARAVCAGVARVIQNMTQHDRLCVRPPSLLTGLESASSPACQGGVRFHSDSI